MKTDPLQKNLMHESPVKKKVSQSDVNFADTVAKETGKINQLMAGVIRHAGGMGGQEMDPLKMGEMMIRLLEMSKGAKQESLMSRMAKNMEEMVKLQQLNLGNGLQGKNIEALGNLIAYDGETKTVSYDMPHGAQAASAMIQNEKGETIHVDRLPPQKGGRYTYQWDGKIKSEDGQEIIEAEQGNYHVIITAMDSQGQTIDVPVYTSQKITHVDFDQGEVIPYAGNLPLSFDQIRRLKSA